MKYVILLCVVSLACALPAQEIVSLWPGTPPHAKASSVEETVLESWGVLCVKNVTTPTLTVYRAQGECSGRAMVICPGGGYELESFMAEGHEIARALSARGVVGAVLKYRLPLKEISDTPHLLPLTDTRRAIHLVKSRADEFGIDPSKVGVMGFSAGGHLATAVSVLASKVPTENPDFSGLIYPVTTLGPENQKWLEDTLYHRKMTPKEQAQYRLVDHVTSSTPPAFLLHTYDDDVVPIEESLVYAKALAEAGQAVEAHYFAKGRHGFGPGRPSDGTSQWLGLLANWIKRQ